MVVQISIAVPFIVLFLMSYYLPYALCKESEELKKGIAQYKEENYEEAVEILIRAREQDPESSVAAFFLGLAYKQITDFPNAATHLRDAVTLKPKVKEALVELIDVLLQLDEVGEARQWIEVAEKENIFPPKTAFLKGLLLKKEGKNLEAIQSFEKAKSLDESLSQATEFQIALCYVKERRYDDAKKRLQTSILLNPQTDLAGYARQYTDLVEERKFAERPLRFTLSVFGQYDTNLILKPIDSALAGGISDKKVWGLLTSMRVDFIPNFKSNWLFNASNTTSFNIHNKYTHSHDFYANTTSGAVGYNFGKFALNLAGNYSIAYVRNPSYKRYVNTVDGGPLIRSLVGNSHVLELFCGYQKSQYFTPPLTQDEDRDSVGMKAYANWIWLYTRGGFINFRYDFLQQETDGINWVNVGHNFSGNFTLPIFDRLSLQLSGSASMDDYQEKHTVFEVKRNDDVYSGTAGVLFKLFKDVSLIAQYTRVRSDSNIGIYDYEREVYTTGVEYRF